jgi:thiol-disulfide isomerase/thioredoxin
MNQKCDKQIVVFSADGCHACHEYLPRFRKIAVKYRAFIDIKSGNISKTGEIQKIADKYKIEAVPTTLVLSASGEVLHRHVGGIDDRKIVKMFEKAIG